MVISMKHVRKISCCIVGTAGGFVIVNLVEFAVLLLLLEQKGWDYIFHGHPNWLMWTLQICWWTFGIFEGLLWGARVVLKAELEDLKTTLQNLKNTSNGDNQNVTPNR